MTEQLQSEHDDDQMRQLLKPLADEAAPVDRELLARLRTSSQRALTESKTQHYESPSLTVRRVESPNKGRGMFALTTRAVISVTTVVVGGVLLFFAGIDANADSTLGEVLDATRLSKSLQLKVVRDGDVANVWMQEGGRMRWEESPTSYQIADGTTLWEIDEASNSAHRSDNQLLASAAENLDLLALLGVDTAGSASLRNAKPVGMVTHDGTQCRMYHAISTINQQELLFEAYVDSKTNQLRSIAAWPAEKIKRDGPPVVELRLVARNIEIDESQFEWNKSLSEDGRIGKVTDTQGIVLLRPKLNRRWTPVCGQIRLKPGDQLRTDVRGANAVSARLTSGATITVGPGTLVELISAKVIRVQAGEIQIADGKLAEIEVQGPMQGVMRPANDEPVLYRSDRTGELTTFKQKPIWLLGFEGASTNESIGSLITKVDGRDVPLTIGYHKVNVEIRDQIARTTIEESFVNRTNSRLEGIFHFPLPQDASISGFGMWINGNLIEADVVEKQRAREIYETILREKRDPGLLEWTGGNIFKARVFPIEPHSEKRIKIVYTQVLPLRANQYRYSYALRSEMLQKTPLRELSINVLINSALPLSKVDSPTHPVRIEQTERSSSIQFSAQEYSPTRDFELVCDLGGRTSDVVTIPHRRGDDGYFMIQLMPPSAEGNWQREVLPDGEPLEVFLVCDTSGSMDQANRKTQAEFVGSVLSSLGPNDRFNLAVCDADCQWLFDKSVSVDEANVAQARNWLEERVSLGWTDLDTAFKSIQKKVGEKTQVVYIGDGIVSARDVNAQEFAARVRRMYGNQPRGTFHAVSTGSSFESVVLKAIASMGRGSVRSIGSGQTPMSVALELLNEMAQPGLRDLKVEFRGVQVAAVYPEQLPNLAAGTQQIIIGRYLPTGQDQSGEIVVTGTRGGDPVKYSAKIPLKDAEHGNSFIPRLWARAHLDHLLLQGSSQFLKDEIIGLSEEFHIITPYTSLLVLESDEDRERFGVKRRFEMRDGERFFADGRNNANYELLQKVLSEAGNWRMGLRFQVLRQLSQLGRDSRSVQQMVQVVERQKSKLLNSLTSPMSAGATRYDLFESRSEIVDFDGEGYGFGGGGGFGGFLGDGLSAELGAVNGPMTKEALRLENHTVFNPVPDWSVQFSENGEREDLEKSLEELSSKELESDEMLSAGLKLVSDKKGWAGQRGGEYLNDYQSDSSPEFDRKNLAQTFAGYGPFEPESRTRWLLLSHAQSEFNRPWGGRVSSYTPNYVAWLNTLFPSLPAPSANTLPKPKPVESDWPDEAIQLSKSLLRNDWLNNLQGGLEILQSSDSFDPRWMRQTGHNDRLELYSKSAWLNWNVSGGSEKLIHWYDAKESGAISTTFSLGSVRKSEPGDRMTSISAGYFSFGEGLHLPYAEYDVEIANGPEITQLLLTYKNSPKNQQRFSIDVVKHVIVKSETLLEGKVTSATTYSDFVEIQGAWWAQKSETVDARERTVSKTATSFTQLDDAAFAKRQAEELSVRDQIQFLHYPVPTVEQGETAEADGSADFEDRLALIVRSSQIQKWDEVLKQLEKLEALVGDKAGKRWIRIEILKAARRNAEALEMIRAEAARLADPQPTDLSRAHHLVNSAFSIADSNETLLLVNQLQPVFDRQPEYSGANWTSQENRIRCLRSLSRMEELLALEKTYVEQQPWAIYLQTQYARDLANAGMDQAAYDWLKSIVDRDRELFDVYSRDQIWRTWADLLQDRGESTAQIEVMQQWLADKPESEEPYMRYLASLVFDDQLEQADKIAREWIAAGRVDGELPSSERAKTGAAINYAMGQGWNYNYDTIALEWFEPLKSTALFFMNHEHHFEYTRRIMDNYRFSNSDTADEVRSKLFEELQQNAATLSPNRLYDFIRWVQGGKPDRTPDDWQPIVQVIRKRWDNLKQTDLSDDEKHSLSNPLNQLYSSVFRESEYLPFLREKIAQANEVWRDQYVMELFNVLLTEPWAENLETELFGLVTEIAKYAPTTQLATQIEAVQRLDDRMLAARVEVERKKLQDTGHPEELTRQELAIKYSEFEQASREGVAARLAEESKRHDGLLGEWMQMERMYLDVRLKGNLDEIAAECVAILGDKPPVSTKPDPEDQPDAEPIDEGARKELARQATEDLVRAALQQRAFVTYANLAVRKSAKPELQRWLLAYVDAGIEQGGDREPIWKNLKYNLLVALDEPQQLEQIVRTWIREDDYATNWRRLLAHLSAERGELDEAIALFEKIEQDSQLAPSDYASLANWYLVKDKNEQYKRAKIESLKAVQEYQLSNYLRQKRYPWERTDQPLPSELDEQVLFAFQALFEKSSNPGGYLYELGYFYRACRDFRLLQMIPDSVIGRTPQQVYGFLTQLHNSVLHEMSKEATADEILKRIGELRSRELTTIDLRALDLLEAMVERQSSDVLNQPGPHIQNSLVALKRAFERDWADGEGRQMAEFLNSLGYLKHSELAAEQARELRILYQREEPGTDDRLYTGWYLANVNFSPYGKREDGLRQMEIAIREYEQSHPEGWPSHASEPFDGYVSMFEQINRHAEAEIFVKKHLAHPLNNGQKNWLEERLLSVYASALENDSRVSLGEKAELYQNLVPLIVARAEQADDNHRYQVLQRINSVFRTAKRKDFPTLRQDLRKYAFETLPKILNKQRNNYSSLVSQTAYLLKELLEERTGLEFLIDRFENYPARMYYSWDNPWNQFGYQLGQWRANVGNDLGNLEPRLLAIVLKELRRDLENRSQHSRYLFQKSNYFWDAQEAEFVKVAEEVLAANRDSARSVQYIADYFWHGLYHWNRAIEIMFIAMNANQLDDNGLAHLVDWLHDQNGKRYAESIAILEGLIKRNSINMHYRCELITAYHQTARFEQRAKLIQETIELFRQEGRWNESNLHQLALCVHDNGLDQQTIDLTGELIPMHQRSHPTRGIGDGTLPMYYMWLADAHSHLKHTEEAIDAAASAIVSWGPRHTQRNSAVNKLNEVISAAQDLDDYVALIDKRAAETGEDSSIIRRAIGKAYAGRNQHDKAIAQLRISIELQPGDLETHKLLLTSYDALNDKSGAVAQLLDLIDIDRHNLDLYGQLEARLRDDDAQAERAATSVVEAAPSEAEHHEKLAVIREQQNKFVDAVQEWKQVAELRSLEPNGLIHLAKAQLKADQPADARATIEKLRKAEWPTRFETEVSNALTELDNLQKAN